MIIYNITIKVDHAIAAAWLDWEKKEHIPDVLQTGCFTHANILRILDTDDEEGVTYAVQYHAPDKSHYDQYIREFANGLRKKATEKWGDRFIAFRTVMELVN